MLGAVTSSTVMFGSVAVCTVILKLYKRKTPLGGLQPVGRRQSLSSRILGTSHLSSNERRNLVQNIDNVNIH